jgi:hypothetical protein
MWITRMAALVGGALVCAAPLSSFAQGPVALVEDVTGDPTGVAFMDYVDAGKVIRLGRQDSIVLSYMASCVRETIKGGTVTVGVKQSEVLSGQVERTKIDCDAGKMMVTSQQANTTAGLAFRASGPPAYNPQFTLYGSCPMVEVKGSGTLIIERLDRSGERYVLSVGPKPLVGGDFFDLSIGPEQLVHGAFIDFATTGMCLTVGGVYRASWGTQQRIFKVGPGAKPGRAPIIGRLVRLEPAS